MLFSKALLPNRKAWFIDIVSLYPWIACTQKFPVGKPEVFLDSKLKNKIGFHPTLGFVKKDTCTPIYGLVQATVSPPSSIFLPTLPTSLDSKLFYGLCRTCLQERRPRFCTHTENQRLITDVWSTTELSFSLIHCYYKLGSMYAIYADEDCSEIYKEYYTLFAR